MELLIAALFIAMTLPAALDALQLSVRHADGALIDEAYYWALSSKLESVAAQPFSDLNSAAVAAGSINTSTGYSDAAGAAPRVLVYLAAYDGDNADADDDPFTGVDSGLLMVRAVLEQNSALVLETLVTQ